MTEEKIIQHCSPTLAGIKTGNIFTTEFKSGREMCDTIRSFNNRLADKGVRTVPLKYCNGKALIYVFRPEKLQADMRSYLAGRLLTERGYALGKVSRCISRLSKRLCEGEEFPHEIGLFLGYPPKDVLGFIMEKSGKGTRACSECRGMWKVYSDPEDAEIIFAKYRKCTRVYQSCLAKGSTVEKLTVKKEKQN